ncbi:MAG: phytoene desaturase family protein [Thermoplasmatota archaeon]
MPERSIIIIGAGLAGLSAGCYAQMNGYRTQIFEMHNLPGGLCTSWKRKGYIFDGCIHFLMGSRTGSLHRFYEELGAVQGRKIVQNEEFLNVESLSGKSLIVYSDLDKLEKHLKQLSPSDADLIDEICKTARILTCHEMPSEKPAELMGFLDLIKMIKLLPMMRTMGKYGKITVQDFAKRFKDPFLRENFPNMMLDIPDLPMSFFLMTFGYLDHKNNGYPIGGSLEFSKAIAKRYLDIGGRIQYRSRVEKILVENDRAVGVKLEDGTEHRADMVISAADGRTTIFDMLEGKYLNDKIRSYYKEWPICEPYVQISLGVARDLSKEPHSIRLPLEEPIKVGDQMRSSVHVKHFCYDPTMAPKGRSALTASFFFLNYYHWKKLYEDRERYDAEKKKLADIVIERLEKRFPGIKDQIEVVDVATPVTYERYTGNWQGSYMGWMHPTNRKIEFMKRTLPGLNDFYMAGQWVFMGGGVPGAIMSGRHLIQIICKKDKKKFKTSVP